MQSTADTLSECVCARARERNLSHTHAQTHTTLFSSLGPWNVTVTSDTAWLGRRLSDPLPVSNYLTLKIPLELQIQSGRAIIAIPVSKLLSCKLNYYGDLSNNQISYPVDRYLNLSTGGDGTPKRLLCFTGGSVRSLDRFANGELENHLKLMTNCKRQREKLSWWFPTYI